MQKCDFNFIEITLLRGYFSVNMLRIWSRTPFSENTSGELLLYVVLNVEATTKRHPSKPLFFPAGSK